VDLPWDIIVLTLHCDIINLSEYRKKSHYHVTGANAVFSLDNLGKLVKDTKANYYNNAINQCNNDPKSMWKTINQLTNKKSETTKINELIIDL
jgi:hypothetical protein